MAGIQIDGVNNKIDFDDDLDTSISANTDDTLVIEAGGNTMATITATTFTINDGTTITTADNTDTLTLTSTDADGSFGPNLRFYRNSGSPADADDLSTVDFVKNSIVIYPNPANDFIRIQTDITEAARYKIYNMSGQLILSGNVNGPNPLIKLPQLTVGIYIFRLENKSPKLLLINR